MAQPLKENVGVKVEPFVMFTVHPLRLSPIAAQEYVMGVLVSVTVGAVPTVYASLTVALVGIPLIVGPVLS